jgi:anti-sigma factor ChrR (cupin superfamily)
MKHSADDQIKELIALYAFGVLTPEEISDVKTHLLECSECLEEFHSFETVVGTISYNITPITPSITAKEKIFAAIETPLANSIKDEKVVERKPLNPEYFFTLKANEGEWQEISKGVFSKTLFSNMESGTITSVIKMIPGAHAELHYHTSIEECYVIDGDFNVGDSPETTVSLGPGDYHCAKPGSTHAVAYTNNGTQLLVIMPLNCEIVCEIPNRN